MPLYNPPQPLDSDLTAIAALTTTAAGLALLDDADAAALRATLELGTMATQAASAVAITGGTLAGITSYLQNGVTGAYGTWQYNGTSVGDVGTSNQVISGGGVGDFGISSRAGNLVLGNNAGTKCTVTTTGIDVTGLVQCDSFRIDQAASAGAVVQSHTVTVNLNGTDYKLMCVAA